MSESRPGREKRGRSTTETRHFLQSRLVAPDQPEPTGEDFADRFGLRRAAPESAPARVGSRSRLRIAQAPSEPRSPDPAVERRRSVQPFFFPPQLTRDNAVRPTPVKRPEMRTWRDSSPVRARLAPSPWSEPRQSRVSSAQIAFAYRS